MNPSTAAHAPRTSAEPGTARVTIGLPVYDGTYFDATLASLLDQTYSAFELVIVDTSESDDVRARAERAASTDPRARYTRLEAGCDAAGAFADARALASPTEFFMWCAADAVVAPSFVERAVNALDAEPDAVLAISGVAAIDAAGEVTRLERYQIEAHAPLPRERFGEVLATDGSTDAIYGVMRASALGNTRGQGGDVFADRVLLAELAMQGRFVEVPDYLIFKRAGARPGEAHARAGQFLGLWSDYAHAAWGARLPVGERLACLARLPWFVRGHGARLARDLRRAAAGTRSS